jgi:hypothetical protein
MEDGSREMGESAERTFASTFRLEQLPVSRHDQRVKHIDARMRDPQRTFGVGDVCTIEIKATKRMRRHHTHANPRQVTLELLGITGYPGWIFSDADYVAFQQPRNWWLLVPPASLQSLVLRPYSMSANDVKRMPPEEVAARVQMVPAVKDATNGKFYCRPGRMDLISRYSAHEVAALNGARLYDTNGTSMPLAQLAPLLAAANQ